MDEIVARDQRASTRKPAFRRLDPISRTPSPTSRSRYRRRRRPLFLSVYDDERDDSDADHNDDVAATPKTPGAATDASATPQSKRRRKSKRRLTLGKDMSKGKRRKLRIEEEEILRALEADSDLDGGEEILDCIRVAGGRLMLGPNSNQAQHVSATASGQDRVPLQSEAGSRPAQKSSRPNKVAAAEDSEKTKDGERGRLRQSTLPRSFFKAPSPNRDDEITSPSSVSDMGEGLGIHPPTEGAGKSVADTMETQSEDSGMGVETQDECQESQAAAKAPSPPARPSADVPPSTFEIPRTSEDVVSPPSNHTTSSRSTPAIMQTLIEQPMELAVRPSSSQTGVNGDQAAGTVVVVSEPSSASTTDTEQPQTNGDRFKVTYNSAALLSLKFAVSRFPKDKTLQITGNEISDPATKRASWRLLESAIGKQWAMDLSAQRVLVNWKFPLRCQEDLDKCVRKLCKHRRTVHEIILCDLGRGKTLPVDAQQNIRTLEKKDPDFWKGKVEPPPVDARQNIGALEKKGPESWKEKVEPYEESTTSHGEHGEDAPMLNTGEASPSTNALSHSKKWNRDTPEPLKVPVRLAAASESAIPSVKRRAIEANPSPPAIPKPSWRTTGANTGGVFSRMASILPSHTSRWRSGGLRITQQSPKQQSPKATPEPRDEIPALEPIVQTVAVESGPKSNEPASKKTPVPADPKEDNVTAAVTTIPISETPAAADTPVEPTPEASNTPAEATVQSKPAAEQPASEPPQEPERQPEETPRTSSSASPSVASQTASRKPATKARGKPRKFPLPPGYNTNLVGGFSIQPQAVKPVESQAVPTIVISGSQHAWRAFPHSATQRADKSSTSGWRAVPTVKPSSTPSMSSGSQSATPAVTDPANTAPAESSNQMHMWRAVQTKKPNQSVSESRPAPNIPEAVETVGLSKSVSAFSDSLALAIPQGEKEEVPTATEAPAVAEPTSAFIPHGTPLAGEEITTEDAHRFEPMDLDIPEVNAPKDTKLLAETKALSPAPQTAATGTKETPLSTLQTPAIETPRWHTIQLGEITPTLSPAALPSDNNPEPAAQDSTEINSHHNDVDDGAASELPSSLDMQNINASADILIWAFEGANVAPPPASTAEGVESVTPADVPAKGVAPKGSAKRKAPARGKKFAKKAKTKAALPSKKSLTTVLKVPTQALAKVLGGDTLRPEVEVVAPPPQQQQPPVPSPTPHLDPLVAMKEAETAPPTPAPGASSTPTPAASSTPTPAASSTPSPAASPTPSSATSPTPTPAASPTPVLAALAPASTPAAASATPASAPASTSASPVTVPAAPATPASPAPSVPILPKPVVAPTTLRLTALDSPLQQKQLTPPFTSVNIPRPQPYRRPDPPADPTARAAPTAPAPRPPAPKPLKWTTPATEALVRKKSEEQLRKPGRLDSLSSARPILHRPTSAISRPPYAKPADLPATEEAVPPSPPSPARKASTGTVLVYAPPPVHPDALRPAAYVPKPRAAVAPPPPPLRPVEFQRIPNSPPVPSSKMPPLVRRDNFLYWEPNSDRAKGTSATRELKLPTLERTNSPTLPLTLPPAAPLTFSGPAKPCDMVFTIHRFGTPEFKLCLEGVQIMDTHDNTKLDWKKLFEHCVNNLQFDDYREVLVVNWCVVVDDQETLDRGMSLGRYHGRGRGNEVVVVAVDKTGRPKDREVIEALKRGRRKVREEEEGMEA